MIKSGGEEDVSDDSGLRCWCYIPRLCIVVWVVGEQVKSKKCRAKCLWEIYTKGHIYP